MQTQSNPTQPDHGHLRLTSGTQDHVKVTSILLVKVMSLSLQGSFRFMSEEFPSGSYQFHVRAQSRATSVAILDVFPTEKDETKDETTQTKTTKQITKQGTKKRQQNDETIVLNKRKQELSKAQPSTSRTYGSPAETQYGSQVTCTSRTLHSTVPAPRHALVDAVD